MGTFKDGLPHGYGKEQYPCNFLDYIGGCAVGTFVCHVSYFSNSGVKAGFCFRFGMNNADCARSRMFMRVVRLFTARLVKVEKSASEFSLGL